jgi:hypothetical protein
MCLSTGYREGKIESFQGRSQNFKKGLPGLRHVCQSCPYAWNNSARTGWIFMKFDTAVFLQNLSRKLKFREKLTRMVGTLHEKHFTVFTISL